MRTHHIAATLIATGLAACLAPAAAAPVASADAGVETCSLRLVTTKAVNLQHDAEGSDQVRAMLGNTIGRDRSYTLGQRRNTLHDAEERFTGAAPVHLLVKKTPGRFRLIDTRMVDCRDHTRDLVLTNRDARYKVRAVLSVVP